MKNYHNTLLYIYIYIYIYVFLFFRKRMKTDGGRQDRLLFWPITTSSLDHSTMCYLQDPAALFSDFWPGMINRRPVWAAVLSAVISLTASWLSFSGPHWHQQPQLAAGICIYYFHNAYNSMAASAYLHRCVTDWQRGQRSICNMISCTILNILDYFNAVVWMVTFLTLICFISIFLRFLKTVPM